MRELEKASGVGRETIRFYIREGLLPEPTRASRNSAFYTQEHVRRLWTIKRLQEERFLPLAVIRTLLDAEDDAHLLANQAFPMLDALLKARLEPVNGRVPLVDVFKAHGLDVALADGHAETGMISIAADGTVSAADAEILDTLKALWDLGLTRDRGFAPSEMQPFVDLIDWLVRHEMKMFFEHMGGRIGEAEAAEIATRAVALINQLLAQLHNRAVLRALGERRNVANDNASDDQQEGDSHITS